MGNIAKYCDGKFRGILRGYFHFSLILGMVLLLLLALEGMARVWFVLRTSKGHGVVIERTKAEEKGRFMEGAPLELDRVQWQPYVYFRRRPYESAHIHVDDEGHRRTTNFSSFSDSKTRIFVFGGSTIWGTGVADGETIPSLLSEELFERGVRNFHITNFGETAYVNTQEMLTFLFELRKGNIPSLVIFYDGANEVFSSCINNEAGYTQFEKQISFKPLIDRAISELSWFDLLQRDSFLVKGMAKLGQYIRNERKGRAVPYNVKSLAKETVQVYSKNLETLQLLSAKYGFRALYFWQPNIYGKPNLSPSEKQYLDSLNEISREIGEVMVATDAYISENPPSQKEFHSLTDVLKDENGSLFRDSVHLTVEGNRIVQRAMADFLTTGSESFPPLL